MKLKDLFGFNASNRSIKSPLIVAEAGVNHEGRYDLAERLIDEAAEAGADCIKFQTYKAETIASRNSPSYWDLGKESTTSQYALFKKYDKFWKKEYEALKKHCDVAGIEFLSTPFDLESALFLNDLMDVFKISSSDITNKPFIEYICGFGKPVLLSVGGSYFWEAARAAEWIEGKGNRLALLHCVLNYPTLDENANLGMILDLKARFPGRVIGYSDHTFPADMKVLELATMLGAEILEKHFTFDKSLPGNDHYHAMDKEDLKAFKRLLERDFGILGSFEKTSLPSEETARANARRSLVAKRPISRGETIARESLTWKRPGGGISPEAIEEIIGKIALREIAEDEILKWNMLG